MSDAVKRAIEALDELEKGRAERLRKAGLSHAGENTRHAKRRASSRPFEHREEPE